MVDLLLYGLIAIAILVPFVVLPEILERWGYEPRSRFVRLLVWSCFVLLLLVPVVLSGTAGTVFGAGQWLLLFGAVSFAMLWEYYRLHPGTFP
jgi:hypothetical protein